MICARFDSRNGPRLKSAVSGVIRNEASDSFVVPPSRYCQRSTCGKRGVDDGIRGGAKDYTANVPELMRRIRERLLIARPKPTGVTLEPIISAGHNADQNGEKQSLQFAAHGTKHGIGHSRLHNRRLPFVQDQ